MNKLARFLQTILPSSKKSKSWRNRQCRRFFPRKIVFQPNKSKRTLFVRFYKQQQLSIYLLTLKNCLWTCFRIIEIVFYLDKSQKFQKFQLFCDKIRKVLQVWGQLWNQNRHSPLAWQYPFQVTSLSAIVWLFWKFVWGWDHVWYSAWRGCSTLQVFRNLGVEARDKDCGLLPFKVLEMDGLKRRETPWLRAILAPRFAWFQVYLLVQIWSRDVRDDSLSKRPMDRVDLPWKMGVSIFGANRARPAPLHLWHGT